ncbi:MAG TPA: sensor histidine kinase [Chloroflexota bacterium]|nr:sensor histidine kinase [Chloroflexota bacterium]
MVLVSLSIALSLGDGKDWLQMFIYTSAIMGICLPLRNAPLAIGALPTWILSKWRYNRPLRTAPLAIGALALLTLALGVIEHDDRVALVQLLFVMMVTNFSVISLRWLVATIRELRAAREEVARLAVTEERLRFARELHDLLGHSLSLIALKSELAGHLSAVAPERAAHEMRDVESVARTALQEVRSAVAGYRQPTLASELRAAQEILTAAGISYACEGESGTLPPAVEAALSWVVREGVTNVIRHSRARRCTIRLTRDARYAGVSVIDDGCGAASAAVPLAAMGIAGSGLTGLAERVAAIGGRCELGAAAPGDGERRGRLSDQGCAGGRAGRGDPQGHGRRARDRS